MQGVPSGPIIQEKGKLEKSASSSEDVLTHHEAISPVSEMTREASLALDMGNVMSRNSQCTILWPKSLGDDQGIIPCIRYGKRYVQKFTMHNTLAQVS